MRFAILWSHPSGYMGASFKCLESYGHSIFISHYKSNFQAPFSDEAFSGGPHSDKIEWQDKGATNKTILIDKLKAYEPDIIICGGWNNRVYIDVCKFFKKEFNTKNILCFDTIWTSSMRQTVGKFWFKSFIRKYFDYAFIPGHPQIEAALNLGFKFSKTILGLYSPNTAILYNKSNEYCTANSGFIYIGRLSPEKGIKVLLEAYRKYRATVNNPWNLTIAGEGPLRNLAENVEGVILKGFIQPNQLRGVMIQSACMVVPSTFEPWGVQISEAATVGLPIIATINCGSAAHLVWPNFNGILIEAGSSEQLVDAFTRIHNSNNLIQYSLNSRRLSQQFTSDFFVRNLLDKLL